MSAGVMLECTVHPLGKAPSPLRFTVMFARYRGQWLNVRHRERTTWECAGGHIEPGETPLECARRELREEGGVVRAELIELIDYWARDTMGHSSGRVFLAFVEELEELSGQFEMAERMLSDTPPTSLTYPLIYNTLFPLAEAQCKQKEGIMP